MPAIKTGRNKLANAEFSEYVHEALGGFYLPCDTTDARVVYNNGTGYQIGEPCSWETGSGYVQDVNGNADFTIVNIDSDSDNPVIGNTITGGHSGNAVTVASYDSYACVYDKAKDLSVGQSGTQEMDGDDVVVGVAGMNTFSKNWEAPDGNNCFFGIVYSITTSATTGSTALEIGSPATKNSYGLSSTGGFVGTTASRDVIASGAGNYDTAAVGNDKFMVAAGYVDFDNSTFHWYRYNPLQSTPFVADSMALSNFTAAKSADTDTILNAVFRYKAITMMHPVKAGITDAEMQTILSEWLTSANSTTTANARRLCDGKTGLWRLIPDDISGGA